MSKKVKYIISISLVVIIMSLGIITLIMGLVPVGSNDAINLPNDVYIYTNGNGTDAEKQRGKIELHRRPGDENSEVVNRIFDLFNKGFEQKALTAVFRGELGSGLEFVNDYTDINKYKDDNDKITIVFCYDDAQKVNGANKNYNGYRYVCFTVDNSDEWKDVVFGLPNSLNTEDSESGSYNLTCQYSFKGKMKTAELYKYVLEIVERNIW